jgi:hypothetical protein
VPIALLGGRLAARLRTGAGVTGSGGDVEEEAVKRARNVDNFDVHDHEMLPYLPLH